MKFILNIFLVVGCTNTIYSQIEKSFCRFEWGSSVADVLANEELTLKNKTETELEYLAQLSDIHLQVDYDFDNDKLNSIMFQPLRHHPKARPTAPRMTNVSTDIATVNLEFTTVESKLISLLNSTYEECVGNLNSCYEEGFNSTNNKSKSLDEMKLALSNFFENNSAEKYCVIKHRWKNTVNNSYYDLCIQYNKEALSVNGKIWQCTWWLIIRPLKK